MSISRNWYATVSEIWFHWWVLQETDIVTCTLDNLFRFCFAKNTFRLAVDLAWNCLVSSPHIWVDIWLLQQMRDRALQLASLSRDGQQPRFCIHHSGDTTWTYKEYLTSVCTFLQSLSFTIQYDTCSNCKSNTALFETDIVNEHITNQDAFVSCRNAEIY